MDQGQKFELFSEPEPGEKAGHTATFESPKAPYDVFMESEGVPIYREIGHHDVRELELGDWDRYGIRGAFLQLLGTEGLWGMYVAELPPTAATTPERHIYEETFFVLEGRGTTEVWGRSESRRTIFEWSAGSLFSIPLNAAHRVVNATRDRALFIVGTTAPSAFNLFPETSFIFDNPYQFTGERSIEAGDDYFRYIDELYVDPHRGRAMQMSNYLPDVVNCSLPLDNQRSPGFRRIETRMGTGHFYSFVNQYEIGRYSKAHYHRAGAALICLKGKGYSYTWPRELGPHPWADGRSEGVLKQEYVAGGMVAAAPAGGDWFHQHFGIGREPIRFLVYCGLASDAWAVQAAGATPGTKAIVSSVPLEGGGRSIDYPDEDPFIRREYEALLAAGGVPSQMTDDLYRR